jgi:hypothetical protein
VHHEGLRVDGLALHADRDVDLVERGDGSAGRMLS